MRESDEKAILSHSPVGATVRWYSQGSDPESRLVQAIKNGRVDRGE